MNEMQMPHGTDIGEFHLHSSSFQNNFIVHLHLNLVSSLLALFATKYLEWQTKLSVQLSFCCTSKEIGKKMSLVLSNTKYQNILKRL